MKKIEQKTGAKKPSAHAPIKAKSAPTRPQKSADEPSARTLLAALKKTQQMMAETREQVAYLYGAIEELAQRQEIQSHWQISAVRQMLSSSMPVPAGPQGRSFSTNDGMSEIAMLTEMPSGDNVSPLIISEMMKAAETALGKLSEARSEERAQGIKALQDMVESVRAPESRTDEPTIMVVPRRDDVH